MICVCAGDAYAAATRALTRWKEEKVERKLSRHARRLEENRNKADNDHNMSASAQPATVTATDSSGRAKRKRKSAAHDERASEQADNASDSVVTKRQLLQDKKNVSARVGYSKMSAEAKASKRNIEQEKEHRRALKAQGALANKKAPKQAARASKNKAARSEEEQEAEEESENEEEAEPDTRAAATALPGAKRVRAEDKSGGGKKGGRQSAAAKKKAQAAEEIHHPPPAEHASAAPLSHQAARKKRHTRSSGSVVAAEEMKRSHRRVDCTKQAAASAPPNATVLQALSLDSSASAAELTHASHNSSAMGRSLFDQISRSTQAASQAQQELQLFKDELARKEQQQQEQRKLFQLTFGQFCRVWIF